MKKLGLKVQRVSKRYKVADSDFPNNFNSFFYGKSLQIGELQTDSSILLSRVGLYKR